MIDLDLTSILLFFLTHAKTTTTLKAALDFLFPAGQI